MRGATVRMDRRKLGTVTINDVLYNIHAWSVEVTANISEMAAYGDPWQTRVGGIPGATFSCDGYLDSETLPKTDAGSGPGSTCAFTFMQDATRGFTGIAVLGTVGITHSNDGTIDVTCSGSVNGTLGSIDP